MTLPTTALRFQGVEPPNAALPRGVGADNVSVYGDLLGLTPEEVEELAAAGSI